MSKLLGQDHDALQTKDLKNKNIHLIGGGGVGISALGQLLLQLGFSVSASDKQDTFYLKQLGKANASTWVGSIPQNIPDHSIIFHSTAIPKDDLEIQYAQERNIPVFPRHFLLEWITSQFFTIAISGTHGKTTTSAWAANLLIKAGFDPIALVGGSILKWKSNFRMGKGVYQDKTLFLIEADESDHSFLFIRSKITLLTNIEMDHVDQHDSFEELSQSFVQFAKNSVDEGGALIPSLEIYPQNHSEIIDITKRQKNPSIQNILDQIHIHPERHCLVYKDDEFPIGLKGMHNLWNASCILALGLFLNIKTSVIKNTLSDFTGVARRMQVIFSNKHLTVMDDYAHHPKEIYSVYSTFYKEKYKKIYIAWEPHRISRFCYFIDEFYDLFSSKIGWENLILLPLYNSGDREEDFPEYKKNIARFRENAYLDLSQNIDRLKWEEISLQTENTIIIFMGAGKSSQYAYEFIEYLKFK